MINVKEYNSLQSFISDTLTQNPLRLLCVPFRNPIIQYDCGTGVVLYRQSPFQIEMFIIFPDSIIPPHRHPNVDSFEMYIGGEIHFALDNIPILPAEDIVEGVQGLPAKGGELMSVPHTQLHGGTFGSDGGVFLSWQCWLNNVKPSSVVYDWEGEVMGPMHESSILQTEAER